MVFALANPPDGESEGFEHLQQLSEPLMVSNETKHVQPCRLSMLMNSFNSVSNCLRRKDVMYPISGLVKCANDGYSMSVISRKYKNSTVPMVRHCTKFDYTTGEKCTNKTISVEKVEDHMKEVFWNDIRPKMMKLSKELAKGGKLQKSKEKKKSELAELVKQKKELDRQIDHLVELQIQTGVNERLVTRMKQLESQLKMVNDEIQRLQELEGTDGELAWVEDFMEDAELFIGFPFNYNSMSNEDKNVFWKKWFKGVQVLDGEVVGHEFTGEINSLLGMIEDEQ